MEETHAKYFAYNSRLDTIQAVIASHLLTKLQDITACRIANAKYLDAALSSIDGVTIPPRDSDRVTHVFHIYSLIFEQRDKLAEFLISKGVDAKIHYPLPMHLQPAAIPLGYKEGDFPHTERISKETLSLPVHEFVSQQDLDYMVALISEFYQ